MPSCEHPQGERHCPNHGPAWSDRTAKVLDEIAALVNHHIAYTLVESVEAALERAKDMGYDAGYEDARLAAEEG